MEHPLFKIQQPTYIRSTKPILRHELIRKYPTFLHPLVLARVDDLPITSAQEPESKLALAALKRAVGREEILFGLNDVPYRLPTETECLWFATYAYVAALVKSVIGFGLVVNVEPYGEAVMDLRLNGGTTDPVFQVTQKDGPFTRDDLILLAEV